MRIPGLRRDRGGEAYEQTPSQVICPVCGLRNDSMARFCRNCGLPLGAPRDPVRGTTNRRADLPSEHGTGIAAVVGLVAAVVVLVGAGFLILRGESGAANIPISLLGSPSPSAPPSLPPTAAPPSGVPGSPGPSVDPSQPAGSAAPTARATPDASADPSAVPSATPRVADTGFTCEPAGFADPTRGTWRVARALWGSRSGGFDRVTIVLERQRGRGGTDLHIEALPAGEVDQVTGLDDPTGRRAVVVTFDGSTEIRQELAARTSLRAVSSLNVGMGGGGHMYAVVGVTGNGCFRLSVPGWRDVANVPLGDEIQLFIDVRRR